MRKTLFLCFIMLAMLTSCGSSDDAEPADYSGYTYELPVIFHVLYKDKSDSRQYIPYARLTQLLDYVNQIYQGNIYGPSENTHLKFVLATKDENGKTLEQPGVEYVYYDGSYPIEPSEFMSDKSGKNVKYIWEPNNYVNIMMYNFKQETTGEVVLGLTSMPYYVEGHEVKGLSKAPATLTKKNLQYAYGVSINSLYANTDDDGNYYQSDRYTNADHQYSYITSFDIVVTMAHELGHSLGLFHTFAEKNTDGGTEPADICDDTDYCTDTKSYNRYEYEEYLNSMSPTNGSVTLEKALRRNACDGTQYQADNIMDYAFTLGYKITKEQKERIRNVLYYSPLVPGPKSRATRAAQGSDKPVDLKITLIK